jgi:hypothetical protein
MYRSNVLRDFLIKIRSNPLGTRGDAAPDTLRPASGGTEDATPGDVPTSHLAVLLVLIGVATSCAQTPPEPLIFSVPAPSPEPALPTDVDPFTPPAWGTSPPAGAPALAEWTRIATPGAVVALTGSQLVAQNNTAAGPATQFLVFGQNATGSFTGTATLMYTDFMKAAITLPSSLPANSEYLVWPVNGTGTGAPAVINATETWWLGPNAATRGDTVSVYGRNLTHNALARASHVYIQAPGATGMWAQVTAANPYKVDFTVPSALADGTYQVWVHNGRGGHYGWSGPLALTVNDGMTWTSHTYNVKNYGAKGDGKTDDQAAIEAAVEAAARDPWSTIYLPAGTYLVSSGFNPPAKVRWAGQGADRTSIKASAGFVKTAPKGPRDYCLLFTNSVVDNVAVQDLTLDGNGHLNSYAPEPVYMRFDRDIRFTNVTVNGKGFAMADFHGSTRLGFENCTFVGGGSGIFFGSATQIRMDGCLIEGSDDANTMLTSWGGDSISFTNTTGQDYSDKIVDGWAQGRFIYGSSQWGSNRNIYIGDCTTKALAPRPAFPGQNTGEQLSWESGTHYSGTAVAGTARTVTFPAGGAFFSDPGLQSGEYDAVIVNGTGLGQHRKIVACTGSTVTVAPAWNVAPDSSSTVLIAGVLSHVAVYHNSLQGKSTYAVQVTASAGIQPYGNSYDFIADSNTVSQVRNGIYLWAMAEDSLSPKSITCVYFNYIANNVTKNCLSGVVGVSQAWQGWPAGDPYPGISFFANTCVKNTASGMTDSGFAQRAETAPVGDQMDLNVFDHNSAEQAPVGFAPQSNAHVANTQVYGNAWNGATNPSPAVQKAAW